MGLGLESERRGLFGRVLILPGDMQYEIRKVKHEKEVWGVNQGHQGPYPNRLHVQTQIPAAQAEQVDDDVAPVTAEYVPIKARNVREVDSKTRL